VALFEMDADDDAEDDFMLADIDDDDLVTFEEAFIGKRFNFFIRFLNFFRIRISKVNAI
jgi:hypothetical protein